MSKKMFQEQFVDLLTDFMYNNLLSFGDVIELRLQCNVSKLLDNIKPFDWKQYNPR